MPETSYSIKPIINVLSATRKRRQIRQSELGESLGLPQSHISDIEKGKKDIRLSTLIEIARVLGLELVLIPRELLPAVTSLSSASSSPDKEERPAYDLESMDIDNE